MTEYRVERWIQTTYLSVIAVIPAARQGLGDVLELPDQEPKRKVLRVTPQAMMTCSEVNKVLQDMPNWC